MDRLDPPLMPAAASPAPAALDLPHGTLTLDRRIAVMGIVNRTPDSFYDRGATFGLDESLERACRLLDEGADLVDVGGVKGGPGEVVTAEEEIDRVAPLVGALRRERPDALVSVDTFRAPVAAAVLEVGADLVNDVTGLSDPALVDVVRDHGAGYVAMHHGGRPRTRPFRRTYEPDVTSAVVEHCRELTDRLVAAGIAPERLVVDPGHDFQKTTWHSLELTRRLPELRALGYPVLVALSNKDFVGETLDVGLEDRVDGSIAAGVFSILRGASILRVHEVARTVQAVHMTEALLGWRPPAVAIRGLE